jgi:hypothetical protein
MLFFGVFEKMMFCNEVDRDVIFVDRDIRMVCHFREQGSFNFLSRQICCMGDSMLGMASFLSKVELVSMPGKFYTDLHQFLDAFWSLFYQHFNGIEVAQMRPGIHRIGDVRFERVCGR